MAIKMKKLNNAKGIKKSLSGGNNKFAQRVPEEGIEIRLLTEPEEWFQATVHYGDKTSFPCSEGDCLGCEEGMDEGTKFYANAFIPEEDRVVVFEMGTSVAGPIIKKYEKNNTITDRNFEVTKEGAGKNTRYFVDPQDQRRIKGQDDLELIDLEVFMEEWLDRAMKDMAGEEEVSSRGRRHTRATTKRRRPIEEDDIEDDDDDMYDDGDDEEEEEEEEEEARPARRKSTATKTSRPTKSTKSTATKSAAPARKRPMKRRPRA